MRLGQLARQLGVTTDKIVNFLATRDITVENSNNARIDDGFADLVVQHFAPGNDALKEQIAIVPDAPVTPETEPKSTEDEEVGAEPLPDLIKAPKIELPGLRVLGKIELPEKKKAEPLQEAEPVKESMPVPPRRPQKNYPVRERKNPITLAREREEQEKKRKLAELREKEKQRKKEFYEKRLKPQAPTKAVRIVNEEYEEMAPLEPERPKTVWGRFMRWLNT